MICAVKNADSPIPGVDNNRGGSFFLTVGAVLFTVKLLCLQSLKALIRRSFPL